MKISKRLFSICVGTMSLVIGFSSCKKRDTPPPKEVTENDISLLSPDEQKLIASNLDHLMDYYLYDVESFKIANEKTRSNVLKKFAQEEVVSGQKMINTIKAYAEKYNYKLDTVISTGKNNNLFKLTTSDVANFDKIFINTYIESNNKFTDSISNKINQINRVDLKELMENVKNENVLRISQVYKLRDSMY